MLRIQTKLSAPRASAPLNEAIFTDRALAHEPDAPSVTSGHCCTISVIGQPLCWSMALLFSMLFHHRLGVRCRSTLAQQCRSSCREWVPTSLADNKCATCFQILITCSIGQEPADSNDIPYAVPKGCLAAHAECTANCRGQTAPTSGTPNANAEKPK